ncbi:diguanylate cyclase domain-containing protein [Ramlibacter sp. WS9]|uniref:diguanylate cyclase domain-containing protein n=1 Tax=Ramlibacter sp. WS9 TaxID=1882741 RepID=UPI00114218E2|nr:diguanylate cyclase [Ramlibacter sp. WS9]ROZ69426.1 GGDEF domain-containing protein [Ramlibacter sp. WS9]
MTALDVAIWSAAAGAIALVVMVCLVDWVLVRTKAAAQGAAYNFSALLFVVILSGLLTTLAPQLDAEALRPARVLIGPLCVFLGDYWVHDWLAARQRDRLMDVSLRGAAAVALPAGLLCLLLPSTQQLPAAAAIVVLNTALVVWVSVRAWMLGDSLALGIAIGCLAMLPAVGGLYAVALALPGIGSTAQAFMAVFCVACVTVIGFMLWKRNQHERRARGVEAVESQFDPVTKLPGGLPFVRKLLRAQARRRLTRREGAIIAVLVFKPDRIVAQAGTAGLNEMYVHLAERLQRQVGPVNPVGRYWDRCFVALVETIHSRADVRTLGLRVASSLRRPMQVNGPEGRTIQVRADIGVGVVLMERDHSAVEDLLHEAQRLAEAAQTMLSRAATRDPATGETVPVEHAQLGPRRHARGVHAHGTWLRARA